MRWNGLWVEVSSGMKRLTRYSEFLNKVGMELSVQCTLCTIMEILLWKAWNEMISRRFNWKPFWSRDITLYISLNYPHEIQENFYILLKQKCLHKIREWEDITLWLRITSIANCCYTFEFLVSYRILKQRNNPD